MKPLAIMIRAVVAECGVLEADVVTACELAVQTAAAEVYGDARRFEALYDHDAGEVLLHQFMEVVADVDNPNTQVSAAQLEAADTHGEVGEDIGFQVFYLPRHRDMARAQDAQFGALLGLSQQRETLSRIAIHAAKQAVIGCLRDAERGRIVAEYAPIVGQVVCGLVERVGRHDAAMVSLGGGVTALLPKAAQHPRDRLSPGERITAVVASVTADHDAPAVVLSRASEAYLLAALRLTVPEIEEGLIVVTACAREAGNRAKVELYSKRPDVDPVAVCIAHGRDLTDALLGERVDFFEKEPEEEQRVMAAFAPARVSRVEVDEEARFMVAVVPDEDMALAVGVRGVCIRLVARLTGWKVGVISESDSVVQAEAVAVAEVVDREQERVWAAMAAKGEVSA